MQVCELPKMQIIVCLELMEFVEYMDWNNYFMPISLKGDEDVSGT